MKPKKKNRGRNTSDNAKAELTRIKASLTQEYEQHCDEIPVWECTKGNLYALFPGLAQTKHAFDEDDPYKYTVLARFLGRKGDEYEFATLFTVNLQRLGGIRTTPSRLDDGSIATVLTVTDRIVEIGTGSWKLRRRSGIVESFPKTVGEEDQ